MGLNLPSFTLRGGLRNAKLSCLSMYLLNEHAYRLSYPYQMRPIEAASLNGISLTCPVLCTHVH